jgi:hypothetical protein
MNSVFSGSRQPYSCRQQLVELVHGCPYPLGKKAIDGFGYPGNYGLDYRFFLRREITEHITDYSVFANGLLLCLRSADSHPDSREVFASQGGNNRIHALVSAGASALAQANFAQGQVQVIVYYQQVAQRDVVLMHQAGQGFAAQIHKCAWLGQQQLFATYFAGAYSGLALSSVKVDRMKPGEVIQALEANIVAVMGISLAGIPQTNYEFH